MMLVFGDYIEREKAAMDLASEPIAVKALSPVNGEIVAIIKNGIYVGAASYRQSCSFVKIINLGVTTRLKGIGRRLVEEICKRTDCEEIWCHAKPGAMGFYRRLGMTCEILLPDQRGLMRKPC